MENILSKVRNIHLVGIGGIGMSGLALLLKDKGFSVRGSDSKDSLNVARLRQEGINVFIGHNSGQVREDTDLVVYSSAVPQDNPEISAAKEYGINIVKRGELLGIICRGKKTVAISGSHGKTTTTFLLNYVLRSLGYNPAFFAGGVGIDSSRNALWGDDYFIIESDESDASFLYLEPWTSFITNIDYEHLGCYGDMSKLEESFLKFAAQTQEVVFGCGDDSRVGSVLSKVSGISFGLGPHNCFQARGLKFDSEYSYFDFTKGDDKIISVKVPLRGRHNVVNTLGVLSFLSYFNHDLEKAVAAMLDFIPPQRRFQIRGTFGGVTFIDDYAHHPTEIAAALAAARQLAPKHIVAVFQPHRFSRMRDLYDRFLYCFKDADEVVVTDIYSASEPEAPAPDAAGFARELAKKTGKKASYIAKYDLPGQIPVHLSSGDVCLAVGAGDINTVLGQIIGEFRSKSESV